MDELQPPRIDPIDLLSYRRAVADVYGEVQRRGVSEDTWHWWVEQRNVLFARHPASPFVAGGVPFPGLAYHPYDPALHLGAVPVEPAEPGTYELDHSGSGTTPARRFGTVSFSVGGTWCRLALYWLDVYGGGVFLPFRDATNGATTYGGGRYLLDTVKSADLGGDGDRLVLDLNFAYHPSCVHDPRWSCPVAPPENQLSVAVVGGERHPPADG